ncbi:MAG: enoyl-CoA hydratase/isomerase family protein [Ilyomonas sp.]
MSADDKDNNQGYVKASANNQVTTIEFYHPLGNSLPSKLLEDLCTEINVAAQDENAKVIILRSAGDKAFCGGASFNELIAIKDEMEGLHFFSGFANVINAMRKCPKLIIARVHGRCVGGGVGLAAAADYAIATDNAEIKLSELAIGIGPFVVGPAIERKIGVSAFSQLAIDAGMWRNADWAKRKGLFAETHASVESMEESIARLSNSLSHSSSDAMHELKKVLWAGCEHWDELLHQRAAISGKLILSDYSKQFIERFKQKQNT